MDMTTLKQLVELGWPGIATLALAFFIKAYIDDTRNQIDYLRKKVDELESKLNRTIAAQLPQ